jgi:hypothetical protein
MMEGCGGAESGLGQYGRIELDGASTSIVFDLRGKHHKHPVQRALPTPRMMR